MLCAVLAAVSLGWAGAAPAVAALPADPVFLPGTDGGATYACFRIPSLIKVNNGDLLAFAEGRKGTCLDKGNIDVVSKRYDHLTGTWGSFQVVIQGNGETKGNPTAIWVPGTNRVVLLSVYECSTSPCVRVPRVSISTDNGVTFGVPRVITTELGFAVAPGWLALGPGHGVVLSNPAGGHVGRLVAGMSYSSTDTSGNTYHNGALVYSDDQGGTWHRGAVDTRIQDSSLAPVQMDPEEISVVELADGRVYAAARNNTNQIVDGADPCRVGGRDNRAYAISADGGESFYKNFEVESDLVSNTVQGSVMRLDGNRILYAGSSVCDHRSDLRVRWSFDEGCSWQDASQGVQLWNEDAAYTDMTQVGDGVVWMLAETGPTGNSSATISLFKVTSSMLNGTNTGHYVTPDVSAYHNDSCLEGSAVLAAGKFGSAASLDGAGFVHVPMTNSVSTYSGDFTWSGWFTAANLSTVQALVWAYSYGSDRPQFWARVDADGKVHAYMENGATGDVGVATTGAYHDGAWHHFAATRSGDTLTLYLDGVKIGSQSGFAGTLIGGSDFKLALGQNVAGGYRLQGKLDEVRLYKRALSAAEIAVLADPVDGAGGTTSGLTFRLPFDTTRY